MKKKNDQERKWNSQSISKWEKGGIFNLSSVANIHTFNKL